MEINISPYNQVETATTLLLTIVKDEYLYVGRVGDGVIALLGENNTLVQEDKDMFTNYTTPFGRSLKIEWSTYNEKDVHAIVMCSDGISEDIKKESLLPFFNNYLESYKNTPSRKEISKLNNG